MSLCAYMQWRTCSPHQDNNTPCPIQRLRVHLGASTFRYRLSSSAGESHQGPGKPQFLVSLRICVSNAGSWPFHSTLPELPRYPPHPRHPDHQKPRHRSYHLPPQTHQKVHSEGSQTCQSPRLRRPQTGAKKASWKRLLTMAGYGVASLQQRECLSMHWMPSKLPAASSAGHWPADGHIDILYRYMNR